MKYNTNDTKVKILTKDLKKKSFHHLKKVISQNEKFNMSYYTTNINTSANRRQNHITRNNKIKFKAKVWLHLS